MKMACARGIANAMLSRLWLFTAHVLYSREIVSACHLGIV